MHIYARKIGFINRYELYERYQVSRYDCVSAQEGQLLIKLTSFPIHSFNHPLIVSVSTLTPLNPFYYQLR